ncbi:MAG: sugar ABC transporter permease, partial [Clostridiales bacterium]|nr:sugar ABC transporter permease [Clostridiales bacterium]
MRAAKQKANSHLASRNPFKKDSVQSVMMLLPMMFGFFLFTYVPIFYILRYCLFQSNGITSAYIGFRNFERVFTRDAAFWDAMLNTVILSAGKLIIEIPLALFLAVMLNKGIKGTGFFRVTLFLPAITSTAIVGLVFSLMFASFDGIVNNLLQNIGIISAPVNWMGNKW